MREHFITYLFTVLSLVYLMYPAISADNSHDSIAHGIGERLVNLTHGVVEAGADAIETTVHLVRHPVLAAKNISYAASHYNETFHAVKHEIKEKCKDNKWHCAGYGAGNLLMIVLTDGIGAVAKAGGLAVEAAEAVAISVDAVHLTGVAHEASTTVAGNITTLLKTNGTAEGYRQTIIAIPNVQMNGQPMRKLVLTGCDKKRMDFAVSFYGDDRNDYNLYFDKKQFGISKEFCPPLGTVLFDASIMPNTTWSQQQQRILSKP